MCVHVRMCVNRLDAESRYSLPCSVVYRDLTRNENRLRIIFLLMLNLVCGSCFCHRVYGMFIRIYPNMWLVCSCLSLALMQLDDMQRSGHFGFPFPLLLLLLLHPLYASSCYAEILLTLQTMCLHPLLHLPAFLLCRMYV
jgi:hypothetical protein